jgi:precorrin-6B methylase 2
MAVSELFRRTAALTAAVAILSVPAFAQAPSGAQQPYEPSVGQAGKDVVWVPTPQTLVDKMLDLADIRPGELLMDLGSGDGRTVITAAKRGATAIGIEYNPDMVELSTRNAAQAGVTGKATFMKADLFETDLTKAQVITMFLLPSINMKLRPTILNLKPGTRIVSNTFTMEDWQPDATESVDADCTSWCTALLWIVPAKVAGSWRLPDGTLRLTQEFQTISGSLGRHVISDAKLRGDAITFTANGKTYNARVIGDVMTGVGEKAWWGRRVR